MISKFRKPEKSSPKIIFLSFLLAGLILVIFSFLVVTNLDLSRKRKELNSQIVSLEKEIQELEERNLRLKEQLSQITQADYAEKILREKGMYKLPGEKVIVVTREDKEKLVEKENLFEKTSSRAASGFSWIWNKITRLFKKIF